jgi:hypothetical protein
VRAQTPNVRLDPARIDTQVGQTVEMRLRVDNVSALYGLDVRFDFAPSLLEALDTDAEREGIQVSSGDFPYPDFVVRNTVDNAAGTIWYAVIQLNPREPANGSGVMLTMRLRAKASGTATINIAALQLVDRDGLEISATKQNGQVAIAGAGGSTPPPAMPTPTPTRTPSVLPTATPTPTFAQVGATATPGGATATPQGVSPTASPVPPTASAAPSSTLAPGQTPSAMPTGMSPTATLPPLPGLTPSASYPDLPATIPAGGLPPALPVLGTPAGGATRSSGATATRAIAAPTLLRSTPVATRVATAAAPTLAPTSALIAAVIPTARPPATPSPLRQVVRPLIPQGMFICLAIVVVILALVLFLYLARRSRHAIE